VTSSAEPAAFGRQRAGFARLSRVLLRSRVALVVPAVTVMLLLTVYPTIYMLWISLHDWPVIQTLPRPFVGLDQYGYILSDPEFWNSLQVTFTYMACGIAIEVTLGLGLALLLATPHRIFRAFVMPFMLPLFVSPIVVGLIWRMMMGYDLGVLNYLLRSVGLGGVNWLGTSGNALAALVLIDAWQWTPFAILILRAGLDSLAHEPFEAAAIDGASRWQSFWYVTLPLLRPVLMVVLLFRTLDAFKLFDIVFIVTRGGPGDATNVLAYNIWLKGFFENQLGYAAALSVIMVAIATVLATVLIRIFAGQERAP
jgi:multiple sugar transport system permease protein